MTDRPAPGRSWDPAVFDRLDASDPDPWRVETSPYERAKYDATLAALPPGRRFPAALELGCSIGVFTRRLAERCDSLLALDAARSALSRAADRCRDLPHVRFRHALLPAAFPDGRFDLIVLSELLYFLCDADIDALADRVAAALPPDGLVLLVNWTGPTDTPNTGDTAADRFLRRTRHLSPVDASRGESYRLDLRRRDANPPPTRPSR